MTNLLNLEDYNNIKKEKALLQVEKNNWKWYKKTGSKRPVKRFIKLREARKNGISVH